MALLEVTILKSSDITQNISDIREHTVGIYERETY